jgi:hypothetical protein
MAGSHEGKPSFSVRETALLALVLIVPLICLAVLGLVIYALIQFPIRAQWFPIALAVVAVLWAVMLSSNSPPGMAGPGPPS